MQNEQLFMNYINTENNLGPLKNIKNTNSHVGKVVMNEKNLTFGVLICQLMSD